MGLSHRYRAGRGVMTDRQHMFRRITCFVIAALSFAAIITMLTGSLLNAARTGAEAEKANSLFEVGKNNR
jgi:hypothetical protein